VGAGGARVEGAGVEPGAELGAGVDSCSVNREGATIGEYTKYLVKEIQTYASKDRAVQSIYFGGGTPTTLPASDLKLILDTVRESFTVFSDTEITTEANPDTLDADYLDKLKECGFNRLSIGMQSANDKVLQILNRTHRKESLESAVKLAKSKNLDVSLDLIYATPKETLEDWEESLKVAIDFDVSHISCYGLTINKNTPLGKQIQQGIYTEQSQSVQAKKYELADKLLSKAGFYWYEVSNWARVADAGATWAGVSESGARRTGELGVSAGNVQASGLGAEGKSKESLHNSAYWRSDDWLGFGAGAHSHMQATPEIDATLTLAVPKLTTELTKAESTLTPAESTHKPPAKYYRWQNVNSPTKYINQIKQNKIPIENLESIDQKTHLFENVMLKLRTNNGLTLKEYRKYCELASIEYPAKLAKIEELGNALLIEKNALAKKTILLTLQGRLLADYITRILL
jgi:oxygen-independent coproporphyrinogen-3 oxidase